MVAGGRGPHTSGVSGPRTAGGLADEDRALLLEALAEIGAATTVDAFARAVCGRLLELVPGISASYNELNVLAGRAAAVIHPDPGRAWFERFTPVFAETIADHPVLAHLEATGEGGPLTWDDVDPAGRFAATRLFREFYEPNGIRSQLAVTLPAPPGIVVGLAVNRDGAAFTDRERALAAHLRPHLVNLYRLVTAGDGAARSWAALAADGWSVLLVDDDGVVLESNDVAEAAGRAAQVDLGVGASVAPLLAGAPRSEEYWAVSRQGPVDLSAGVPLELRLVRQPVGPHLVWLRPAAGLTVDGVQGLGLSRRQAEVALLLRDGLTNAQMARRLGIAEGTVRKHLEAVFDAFGVRSRAGVVGVLAERAAGRLTTPRGR